MCSTRSTRSAVAQASACLPRSTACGGVSSAGWRGSSEDATPARSLPARARAELEVLHHHQLEHPLIARGRESAPDAELEAMAAAPIVDHGEQGVRLLVAGLEVFQRTEVGIFLEGECKLAAGVPGGAHRGNEFEIADSVKGGVHDRVDDQVEAPEMHADDAADLGCVPTRVPVWRVVAQLEIDAVEERAVVRVRYHEQRAQLGAIEEQLAITCEGVDREVEPGLEPRCDAVCPLGHAVECVIRDDATRECGLRAPGGREVVVPGELPLPGSGDLGVVHLD